MPVKKINIKELQDFAKKLKEAKEDDIPRLWSRKELVDIILYVIENLKK